MKRSFLFCCLLLPALFACVHKGAQSKDVKFYYYELVGDGNNNDSAFFRLVYENKSNHPLLEPYVRMVIKDTSDKFFRPILFSDSKNLDDVPAHQAFEVFFYAKDFQFSNEVGKVKCYLSWTNSKGKNSVRRSVRYE